MAAKSNKNIYLAALSLFLLGIGYLMFSGISENSVYFLNVSEALAKSKDELHATRLFGVVKEGGIVTFIDQPGVQFFLEDKDDVNKNLLVVYKGAVPDTFKAGAEVIIEGGFKNSDSAFEAVTLMTKCPSKYQKENRS